MKRLALLACGFALPAQAVVFEGPLGFVPSAHLLKDREIELGGHYLFLGSTQGQLYQANLGFGATQLGLAYLNAFPGNTTFGPAVEVRHQLLEPSLAKPLALAVGGRLALVGDTPYGLGNNAFVTFSYDFNRQLQGRWMTYATTHLGFMGDVTRARWMGAVEVPLSEWGNGYVEFLGGAEKLPGLLNVGIQARPLPWLILSASNLSAPSGSLWDRNWAFGAAVQFKPPLETPAPKIPQGKGSLTGTVRDMQTRAALGGAKITAENAEVTVLTVSNNEGLYRITELPPGKYQLKVEKPPYIKTFQVEIVPNQNRPLDLLVGGL